MEKLAYSIAEFIQASGIRSRTGVYSEINKGRLKTFKVGRRRLISREAAEQWLERRQREAEEAQI